MCCKCKILGKHKTSTGRVTVLRKKNLLKDVNVNANDERGALYQYDIFSAESLDRCPSLSISIVVSLLYLYTAPIARCSASTDKLCGINFILEPSSAGFQNRSCRSALPVLLLCFQKMSLYSQVKQFPRSRTKTSITSKSATLSVVVSTNYGDARS